MAENPQFDIGKYLDLAYRRKWYIVITFCVSVVIGLVVLKVFPKTYKASTLILLEPQAIPENFVKPTITETVESRIQTIQQQIQSRTNLEAIIDQYQIDKKNFHTPLTKINEMAAKWLPFLAKEDEATSQSRDAQRMERMALVDALRERITITLGKPTKSGRGDNSLSFEVAFEWSNPDIMAPVVNTIVSRFIDENMSAREEKAIGTTDFFEKETAALRGDIEARERELEAFKKANMGMLPDQLQSNLTVLNQLREQVVSLERSLDQDRQQAMFLKSQAALAQSERSPQAQAVQEQRRSGGGARLTTEELTTGDLRSLEDELGRMSSHYTEQHPDVVALKRRIEELKKEGPRSQGAPVASSGRGSSTHAVEMQVSQINGRIESTQREIKEVEKQIQLYKERVERTPQVEMELNKILRDYTTARERYDGLLSKKMDAKMAEQLEKRRKGEQFRVLDPAVKPLKPVKPDPIKIMLGALVAGLGLGCGLAYLREIMDAAFYSAEDLEAYLGVPILVSIPDVNAGVKS